MNFAEAKILALDTSSNLCSVAMLYDQISYEHAKASANNHSDLLLPMIRDLLKETQVSLSDIEALAVGRGPGSFIGLRISLGVCQGMALALSKPIIPISSLAAMAQTSHADRVAIAIDANLGQIFWGCFERDENDLMQPVQEEALIQPSAVTLDMDLSWVAIGNAWNKYQPELLKRLAGAIEQIISYEGAIARGVAELAAHQLHTQGPPTTDIAETDCLSYFIG